MARCFEADCRCAQLKHKGRLNWRRVVVLGCAFTPRCAQWPSKWCKDHQPRSPSLSNSHTPVEATGVTWRSTATDTAKDG